MNRVRRAAFDARLRERLDRRQAQQSSRRAILLPGAALAVAVFASLVFWSGDFGADLASPPAGTGVDGFGAGPALESWERRLFYQDPSVSGVVVSGAGIGGDGDGTSRTDLEVTEDLPAEYAALEWLLLEG